MSRRELSCFWFLALLLLSFSFPQSLCSLSGSQTISSYGVVNYASVIEFGLCISGPYAPSYEDPYYEEPAWQEKLVNSGAKWVRFPVYGVFDSNLVAYHQNQLYTIHDLGINNLVIFGKGLIEYAGRDFTLDDWKNYTRQAITVFNGYVDAIEIWNEPDLPESSYGYMDGSIDHYFNMLKIAYEEIKAVNPKIPVLAGSLATLNEGGIGPGNLWGGTLLKGIWSLGAGNYCDAVSIHTYQFWLNHQNITAGEAIELAHNITGKPIWDSELGAPSSGGWTGESGWEEWTGQKQADWMEKKFNELNEAAVKPKAVIWHIFYGISRFSIVNASNSEKLAYQVFKSFTAT